MTSYLPSARLQLLHAEALVWAHPTMVGDNPLLRALAADARVWVAYQPLSRDPVTTARYDDTRATFMGLLTFVSTCTGLS